VPSWRKPNKYRVFRRRTRNSVINVPNVFYTNQSRQYVLEGTFNKYTVVYVRSIAFDENCVLLLLLTSLYCFSPNEKCSMPFSVPSDSGALGLVQGIKPTIPTRRSMCASLCFSCSNVVGMQAHWSPMFVCFLQGRICLRRIENVCVLQEKRDPTEVSS
jgi:hypothetical protein